jgi:NADH-quinone oxidoreductase subunit C
MEQKAIYDLLAEKLGADALGFNEDGIDAYADIAVGRIAEACMFLRDEESLGFNQLMCLSGIDWDGYDENGKGKSVAILGYLSDGTPEASDRVGEGDFGVAYDLYSHEHNHKFTLRVRVPRDNAVVPTVTGAWPTASWHEREAWDLLGIRFDGHPDLRRILLEEHWVGHPLRKDYVMPATWDNVPLNGKAIDGNPFTKADGTGDDAPAEG